MTLHRLALPYPLNGLPVIGRANNMHSKSVDSLSLTRAGFIEYFLVATKLVHALTAIAPALFLL